MTEKELEKHAWKCINKTRLEVINVLLESIESSIESLKYFINALNEQPENEND